jgi:type II secretory pathway component GspD/PulD (secretin)
MRSLNLGSTKAFLIVAGSLFLASASVAGAAAADAAEAPVRFKPGSYSLSGYLEMVSDASGLALSSGTGEEKARIDVTAREPMNAAQALALVHAQLANADLSLLEDKASGFFRVLHGRDARDSSVPVYDDPAKVPDNDALATYSFRINHSSVEGMARIFRSFSAVNARVIPDPGSGTLFITDTGRSAPKYQEFVRRLDTAERGKETEKLLKERLKAEEEACAPIQASATPLGPQSTLLLVLIGLIALLIGFMARGYVIRRIEGGL